MKNTGIIRNLDSLGRIVLPKEMRTVLDIGEKDPVEILIENDRIILVQHFDPRDLKSRQLLIHHKYDACKATPYWAAKRAHEKYEVPLITIMGGVTQGNECQPWAYHGFNGRKAEVIDAIKSWMQQKH